MNNRTGGTVNCGVFHITSGFYQLDASSMYPLQLKPRNPLEESPCLLYKHGPGAQLPSPKPISLIPFWTTVSSSAITTCPSSVQDIYNKCLWLTSRNEILPTYEFCGVWTKPSEPRAYIFSQRKTKTKQAQDEVGTT